MRFFEFTLKLRDGRIVESDAVAEAWQWSDAFTEACRKAEDRLGLGPWAGIQCIAYATTPIVAGPRAA